MLINRTPKAALFCLVLNIIYVAQLYSQTGGASVPEAWSFSALDFSGIVDLPTGDAHIGIPIFDVPGRRPFPIVLNYSSGILHDQPASWVGLGWNLNAGVISRIVSGSPDDYNGQASNLKETTHGEGSSFAFGAGPLTANFSSSGDRGFSIFSDFSPAIFFSFSQYKYTIDRNWNIFGYLHFQDTNVDREYDQPEISVATGLYPPSQPQDKYIVYGPGPNGKFWSWRKRYNIDNDVCTPDGPCEPAKFFFQNHQGNGNPNWDVYNENIPAQKIDYHFDAAGKIKDFVIWDVDGTRYWYAYPVEILEENSRGQSQDGNHWSQRELKYPYAYAWYLTAILSNDYADNSPTFGSTVDADGNWLGLGDEDFGNWTYFTYQRPLTDYSFAEPYYTSSVEWTEVPYIFNNNYKQRTWGRKQIVYLKTVETPTHKAVFSISQELGGKESGGGTDRTYKLDNIKLHAKTDLVNPIKTAQFRYDYELRPGTPNSTATGQKCLTLKGVKIAGQDQITFLPETTFEYAFNPAYGDKSKYDRWGYYKSDGSWGNHATTSSSDATAWCLTKITYSTGGTLDIEYESDSFYATGNTVHANEAVELGGGVRVSSSTSTDGFGNTSKTKYLYSRFHAYTNSSTSSGVAVTVPPAYGTTAPIYVYPRTDINRYVGYKTAIVIKGYLNAVQPKDAEPNGRTVLEYTTSLDYPDVLDQFASGGVEYLEYATSEFYRRRLIRDSEYSWDSNNNLQLASRVENTLRIERRGQSQWYVYTQPNWSLIDWLWGYAWVDSAFTLREGVLSAKKYANNSRNDLPQKIIEYDWNGTPNRKEKRTQISYAFESGYDPHNVNNNIPSIFTSKNMLSQIAWTSVHDKTGWDIWSGGSMQKMDRTYWTNAHSQDPSFQFYPDWSESWIDKDGDHNNDNGEWQLNIHPTKYDVYCNLSQSEDANAVTSTTIWAYKNTLPIAQIRNATSSQAAVSIFDDNDVSGWAGSNGTWVISSGVYQQTDAVTTAPWDNPKYYNNVSLDEAILEANVRFDETTTPKYIAISKYINSTNFVRFELRRTTSNPVARIYAKKGAASATLDAARSFNANQWYRLRGEIQGSVAKLYLDGELLGTLNDINVDHDIGKIGLCTYATKASFDNVRFYPPTALATSISYDAKTFNITTLTDESGISTSYTYDTFGRLQSVKDLLGNTFKDLTYYYSRQGTSPFDPANPNHVQEKTYRNSTAFTTTRKYFDGLGRYVQTQQNEGTGSVKTATTYDAIGRVHKVTKPFITSSSQAYSQLPINDANAYYTNNHPTYSSGTSPQDKQYDTNPFAFSETAYYNNPLNRASMQTPPGQAYRTGTNPGDPPLKFVKFEYLSNGINEVSGYSNNTLYKQRHTDENGSVNGNIVDTFTDVFGNLVAMNVDPTAATPLKTLFKYDLSGNLTEVKHPKQPLATTYTVNTLSQVIRKDTPDDDIEVDESGFTEYLYDKNGNLRFVKDAKGAAAATPYFIYYKYDKFNRKIEEGTMLVGGSPGNFTQTNADNTSFPTPGSGEILKIKYHYDFAGYASGLPQRNLPGRMDAIEYVSHRFSDPVTQAPRKGYIFYSYDERGRVDWIENFIPTSNNNDGNGNLATRVEYDYDRQDNVTKIYFHRIFPPGGASDALYVWHEYDELGRLKKVFTNTVDTQPGTADGEYTYWPSGQAKRLVLGGTVQGMDYLYNSREWLTQINHQNLVSTQDPGGDGGGGGVPTADRFGQIIGYNKQDHIALGHADFSAQFNGNISWTIHQTQHNTQPLGLSGWVFKYDKANRLSKANWGYYTSQWNGTTSSEPKYDLIGPTTNNGLIQYDANGNIDYMIRYNESNVATNMDYVYVNNANKLDHILGLNGQASGNYGYDANGNVIKDKKKFDNTNGTNTITYDYRNLPTQVKNLNLPTPNTIDFDYDGNDQRISKNDIFYVPGADGKVMSAYKIDGTHLYWNIWGLELIGQRFYDPDNIP